MPKQLEDDVRTAFLRAIEGGASPDELLSAVRVLVRELKREGRPPENVVVTIKDLCGLSHLTIAADTDSSIDFSDRRKMSEIVLKTVIEEYYAGTAPGGGRRPWQGYALEIGDELR